MKRKEYKTKRLILRPLRASDFDRWYDAYVNGLPKQSPWDIEPLKPSRCSESIFNEVMHRHEELAQEDDYYRFYAFEKKTGSIIGLVDFDVYVRGCIQFANFGYRMFNRHWKKGYGREAAVAGLRIGFKHLRMNRLEAAINTDNKASIKLAKSLGMRREGIKKRYWFEDGKWVDQLIYSANPEDIGLKSKRPYKKRVKK